VILSPLEISKGSAAEMLNVSKATVSNWIRSGILSGEKTLLEDDVTTLLKKIRSGQLVKLTNRANKKHSVKTSTSFESRTAGETSRTGSFFTPDHIVDDMLNDYKIDNGSSLCDPCCGEGIFLRRSAAIFGPGVFLFGTDIDPLALGCANKHLGKTKNHFNLSCVNNLFEEETEKHDFIFTNPPWGAHFSEHEKRKLCLLYPEAVSGDSLEYFLIKGFRSLRKGGIMSYLLPESYLNVDRFKTSREYFLKNSSILKIRNYGKIFKGVFTNVIRIDIQKNPPQSSHKIILNDSSTVLQAGFSSEPSLRFNISYKSDLERDLVLSLYERPFTTLKNNSDWSLGIVTGNNSEFVSTERTEDYSLPLVTGKNLSQYRLTGKLSYLKNEFSRMQQVPRNDLFKKEKLFYKFISDKPVFAYDKSGLHSLNSANVLIPRLDKYPVKAVMAILNSKLIGFFYTRKIGGLKVLRSSLEQIPFPADPDHEIILRLNELADNVIKGHGRTKTALNEIDELVNKIYGVKL
jgi:hypothetical protein